MGNQSILQINILLEYAMEDRVPSSIQFEDLQELFPESTSDQSPYSDQLTYTLKSLGDQKLLDVQYHDMKIDGARPAWIRIDSIVGLTPRGREIVQQYLQTAEEAEARNPIGFRRNTS